MESSAVFDVSRQYRYRLDRVWDRTKPRLCFIMLNPSVANETILDPTVTRCMCRAVEMGFGALTVVNIFAFKSTNPEELRGVVDPTGGQENDTHILNALFKSDMRIAAWGSHGKLRGRDLQIKQMIFDSGKDCHHLGLTKTGQPQHPLYIPYSVKPILWSEIISLQKESVTNAARLRCEEGVFGMPLRSYFYDSPTRTNFYTVSGLSRADSRVREQILTCEFWQPREE